MNDTYISTPGGVRATPGVINADPIAASGITIAAAKDVVGTQAVVAGQRYIISLCGTSGGKWFFSITGVCTTEANIEWVGNKGDHLIIKIPRGVTSLHYLLKDQTGVAYMRKSN